MRILLQDTFHVKTRIQRTRRAYLLGSLDLAYCASLGHTDPALEADVRRLFAAIPCSTQPSPRRRSVRRTNRYVPRRAQS